ncbi:ubiquitin carboxyl-terminal hydrolase 16-like [Canna indica]|uniref:ubiquitinyl hydrolase 1 n=1 Tax=Canna indica TaxID=4628 RepID=A0AAQ3JQB3_9LILI|nr:ubiquitin carboxyl-terminal hydrolase 16-like [Canna indica]
MPLLGGIGVSAGVLVFLLFVSVFALVARRRWRFAAARQEEVRRLALYAAGEATWAELEAYAAASAANAVAVATETSARPECIVCFSPATARCARCKAVRYCSGKCQIVHWRQGHKDECYPPLVNDKNSGEINVSGLKVVQTEQPCLLDKSLEPKEKPNTKAVDIFPERSEASESIPESTSPYHSSEDDNNDEKTPTNVSLKQRTCSFAASPLTSHSSSNIEKPDNAIAGDNPTEFDVARLRQSSFLRTTLVNCDGNPTIFSTPDLATPCLVINATFCSSDVKDKAPTHNTEADGSLSSGPSNIIATASVEHSITTRDSEITREHQVICPQRIGDGIYVGLNARTENSSAASSSEANSQLNHKQILSLNIEASGSVANGTTIKMQSLESKTSTSLAFASDQISPNGGAQCVASCKYSKVNNSSEGFIRSPDHSGAIANGFSMSTKSSTSGSFANGVSTEVRLLNTKTSRLVSLPSDQLSPVGDDHPTALNESSKVGNDLGGYVESPEVPGATSNSLSASSKRVVKQIVPHKVSKHYPSELMLFPYDLFLKLYNHKKIEFRPCGLINCGNSCYANVVLQCLEFTRPLTAYLLEGLHSKRCPKKDWCFTCELGRLVVSAKQEKSPLSPMGILSHLHNIGSNFGHGKQEDAHEFLRYTINAMQSDCLRESGAKPDGLLAEETTLIQQTFGGYLRSKIRCGKCKSKSERCERMMDLTVEIHGDISTLDQALCRFTSPEILDGENKYECDRCKSYERARKRLTIMEAPNILTIVLKRFQSGKFGKLNKVVQFPEYLNLAHYMSGDDTSPVYQLYAVVVHIDVMNASFSGHYVCYVKDTQGKWYKINDSKVKPVELEKVLSKSAYMLLYARCSPRAPSSVRKAMSRDLVQARKVRNKEAKGISVAPEEKNHLFPQKMTSESANIQSSDMFNERFRPKNDSSSDSSSLFEEGSSCGTEGTRDSTSTEDSTSMSGESDSMNPNSPLRVSEDSNGFTQSPLSPRHSAKADLNESVTRRPDAHSSGKQTDQAHLQRLKHASSGAACSKGNGIPSFLCSDKCEDCRNVTGKRRTTGTDWINPTEVKSSVLLRRSNRERTAQTFY